MDKKIFAILRKLFLLNWPYVDTYKICMIPIFCNVFTESEILAG